MKEKNGFILEVKNIKKTFITGDSKVEALKGISFCLKKGEMLAVMGGSGSGKSTLLNVLGALLIPDDGEDVAEREKGRTVFRGTSCY